MLSFNHASLSQEITKAIVDFLPIENMLVCMTTCKLWYKLIFDNESYHDFKAVKMYPWMGELPNRIVNIFGSISKIDQLPYAKFDSDILIGVIPPSNRNNLKKFEGVADSGYCKIFQGNMQGAAIYYCDSYIRSNFLFKTIYVSKNNQEKEEVIVQIFRHLRKEQTHFIDYDEKKCPYDLFGVYCYKDKKRPLPATKARDFLLENNPITVLESLVKKGSYASVDGSEKFILDGEIEYIKPENKFHIN